MNLSAPSTYLLRANTQRRMMDAVLQAASSLHFLTFVRAISSACFSYRVQSIRILQLANIMGAVVILESPERRRPEAPTPGYNSNIVVLLQPAILESIYLPPTDVRLS